MTWVIICGAYMFIAGVFFGVNIEDRGSSMIVYVKENLKLFVATLLWLPLAIVILIWATICVPEPPEEIKS